MISTLKNRVVSAYVAEHGTAPEVLVHAPGRINLIGEHTDYNMGFVLPGAVRQGICFALGKNSMNRHAWHALDTNESVTLTGADLARKFGGWIDYVLGAWLKIGEQLPNPPMINCTFGADLPDGAGLSSSSALTCGVLFGLNSLLDLGNDRAENARLAHRVERDYVGLRGGIMDQHACMLARKDHLLLLDCRDRSFEHVPFETSDVSLFLINTNVKHNLTETDFNTRADECAEAVRILKQSGDISSLRDVTQAHLDRSTDALSSRLVRRVQFVLDENHRVHRTIEAIHADDWQAVGRMLYESHDGLQNAYEVSCPELDFLVDQSRNETRITGARMMGGGFGGCVLHLCHGMPDPAYFEHAFSLYHASFGHDPDLIEVSLSDGAQILHTYSG